jgi:histidine triad (HIT) family protein
MIKREAPANIIYENEYVICFYGLHSFTDAHVLVVPKKHIVNIMDIEREDGPIIAEIHFAIKEIAKQLGIDESGFRVITNTNKEGGQEVFHMHYHLVGGRQLKWDM